MKTMEYRGYVGSIETSKGDKCLFGKVLGLPDDTAITYEGRNIDELENDFKDAVDDYLTYCEANGVQPRLSK